MGGKALLHLHHSIAVVLKAGVFCSLAAVLSLRGSACKLGRSQLVSRAIFSGDTVISCGSLLLVAYGDGVWDGGTCRWQVCGSRALGGAVCIVPRGDSKTFLRSFITQRC